MLVLSLSRILIGSDAMDVDAPLDAAMADMHLGVDFDLGGDMPFADNDFGPVLSDMQIGDNAENTQNAKKRVCLVLLISFKSVMFRCIIQRLADSDKGMLVKIFDNLATHLKTLENLPPSSLQGSILTPQHPLSPASFSRMLLSQDDQPQAEIIRPKRAAKKPKHIVTLLDSRTELTDDELKVTLTASRFASPDDVGLQIARAQYLEMQNNIRREKDVKRFEKESGRLIEDMVFGVPDGRKFSPSKSKALEAVLNFALSSAGSSVSRFLAGEFQNSSRGKICVVFDF